MTTNDLGDTDSVHKKFLDEDDIQPILFELAGLCEQGADARQRLEQAKLDLKLANDRIAQITNSLRKGEEIGSVSTLSEEGKSILLFFAADPSHDFTTMEIFKLVHPDKAESAERSQSSEYSLVRNQLLELAKARRIHKLPKGRYRWAAGWV